MPTLVHHERQEVIVDSARICEHLDREWDTGDALIPESLAGEVPVQVDEVDRAPQVAVLYVPIPMPTGALRSCVSTLPMCTPEKSKLSRQ